jgi:hypothetical protein
MAEATQDLVDLVIRQRAAEPALLFLDGRRDALAQLGGDVVALLGGQQRA